MRAHGRHTKHRRFPARGRRGPSLRLAALLLLALGTVSGITACTLGPSSSADASPRPETSWSAGNGPLRTGAGAEELEKLVLRELTHGERPNRPFAGTRETEAEDDGAILLVGCGERQTNPGAHPWAFPALTMARAPGLLAPFNQADGAQLMAASCEIPYLGPEPHDITDLFDPELDALAGPEVTAYSAGLWVLPAAKPVRGPVTR